MADDTPNKRNIYACLDAAFTAVFNAPPGTTTDDIIAALKLIYGEAVYAQAVNLVSANVEKTDGE